MELRPELFEFTAEDVMSMHWQVYPVAWPRGRARDLMFDVDLAACIIMLCVQ